jgi:phosphopantetheinyl transferase
MRPVVHIQPVHIQPVQMSRPQQGAPDPGVLTADERARALRFAHADDRHRFVVGRTLMRRVLGILTDIAPADVAITLGPRGKPAVAGGPHFNLSHSGPALALAWSRESPVGIDVEVPVATDAKRGVIARAALTDDENAFAMTLTGAARAAFLMRSWTLKEAVAKAHGDGLALLKRFQLGLSEADLSEANASPYIAAGDLGPALDRWHLFEFRMGEMQGAVASVGTPMRPRFVVHAPVRDLDVMDGAPLPGVAA